MKKKCLIISQKPLLANSCIPPSISIGGQPQSQSASTGNAVTFSVVATGSDLHYQWNVNGLDITGANSANYTINGVTSANAGSYTVEIFNDCGTVLSNVALLVISGSGGTVPPFITQNPTGESLTVGDNISLVVVVTGTSPFTYQWKKNGVNIAGQTSPILAFTNTQIADAGSYTVVITNAGGSVTSQAATLSVHEAGSGGGDGALIGEF